MAFLDISAELLGNDSLTGSLGLDDQELSGLLQGNATVIGELAELVVFESSIPPLLGIGSLIGDGGTADGLVSIISISAFLEGNDSLIGDGFVLDADEEEEPVSHSCVAYDIETCCVSLSLE